MSIWTTMNGCKWEKGGIGIWEEGEVLEKHDGSALTYEEWVHGTKMLDKETTNESDLYDVELGRLQVPKLIKEYIDEVTTQLRMVCGSDSEELSLEEKLAFMHETRHAFGRIALLLSGGAIIAAGSVVGSFICAVVATRTWPELQSFFEDFWYSSQFVYHMGGIFTVVKRVTTFDAVHEIRQLQMMLRHLTCKLTFQKSYDMTGRILRITCSHCILCLSGLFEAQELMAKDRSEDIVPYLPPFNLGHEEGSTPACSWTDDSLEIDLPMM
ncbi:unnamed protein product [Sphenostylis stenocarpa]|uniref:Triacylglycerol lipase N-terminal domain-containing protein n=1 Tax=Sphenostylis stenocarpa TaxID=92480 RepID=A0AA86VE23_9FABA|nr:unnamed protein product [Sphenostylis stenocarpa]